jgi:hypothetical protein
MSNRSMTNQKRSPVQFFARLTFRRIAIFLALLTLAPGLIGTAPLRLARLTVVNKADMAIEVSLTGKEAEQVYYLRIPEGSHSSPAEKSFTVVRDKYTSSIYYVELWDPVYGAQCDDKAQTLDLTHNSRVIVLACDRTPTSGGETPSLVKYGGQNQGRRR